MDQLIVPTSSPSMTTRATSGGGLMVILFFVNGLIPSTGSGGTRFGCSRIRSIQRRLSMPGGSGSRTISPMMSWSTRRLPRTTGTSSEAQVHPLVGRQPDLLDAAPSSVVPQQPPPAVSDRKGLVDRILVPFPYAGADDRVGRVALPAGDAILRPCHADLGVIP